jgi:hypothetical protein
MEQFSIDVSAIRGFGTNQAINCYIHVHVQKSQVALKVLILYQLIHLIRKVEKSVVNVLFRC